IIFQRWLAQQWSLSINQDPSVGPSGPVPVSYYYPYSGYTGPNGITGKLVDLGMYTPGCILPSFWAPANGAIALVRLPPCIQSLNLDQLAIGAFEPGKDPLLAVLDYVMYGSLLTNPVFQITGVPLLDARNAGVCGVICVWEGMSDDLVANQ